MQYFEVLTSQSTSLSEVQQQLQEQDKALLGVVLRRLPARSMAILCRVAIHWAWEGVLML